jgi:hypothetical protein
VKHHNSFIIKSNEFAKVMANELAILKSFYFFLFMILSYFLDQTGKGNFFSFFIFLCRIVNKYCKKKLKMNYIFRLFLINNVPFAL